MSKVGLALTAAWLVLAGPAHGRQAGPGPPQVPAATADVDGELERARDAQRSFERTRRRHFPRGAWQSEDCDEYVGRFCLDHEGDDGWTPVPETPEVVRARLWLLATLDSVARVAPGDEWLLGQRVKYRLEASRPAEALGLLEACPASAWWCEALRAFALHESGRYEEAEPAFERALARMRPEARCAWTDLGPVLGSAARRRYERLDCGSAARRALERAFWHLSDPLWMVTGRERRSEHLARRVRGALERDAASGYGLPWGDDIDELTLRYGWPAGWDVAWRRSPGVGTDRSVHAHRSPDAQRFLVDDLDGPAGEAGPAWDLEASRPHTSWAPAYGKVHPLPYQVAGFRRDGDRLVVAAFDAPPELGGCAVESALFLANSFEVLAGVNGPGSLPLKVREPAPEGSATLFGLELRCSGAPGVARARGSVRATDPLLSDLLLLHPTAELPASLEPALLSARRGSTARPGESVVVFWEWYAPPEPAGALDVTLSLTREDKSFWRKALEWSGLAGQDREEVGIRWSEPGGPEAAARAVELQLPDLAPGRYRLTLQVRSARAGAVVSATEITIVP